LAHLAIGPPPQPAASCGGAIAPWPWLCGMRPARMPQRDARDQGNLPERLLGVSYELAKFLRYRAHESGLCGNDGWMAVQGVIHELGGEWSTDDIRQVVQESYSKDKPRFELKSADGADYVRAFNVEEYRARHSGSGRGGRRDDYREARGGGGSRGYGGGGGERRGDHLEPPPIPSSDWNNWKGGSGQDSSASRGSYADAGAPSSAWSGINASSWNTSAAPAAQEPASSSAAASGSGSRPGGPSSATWNGTSSGSEAKASGASSIFDGEWGNSEGPVCRIEGQVLRWQAGGDAAVKVHGDEIHMSDCQGVIVGKLNAKGELEWSDGDVFRRHPPTHRQEEDSDETADVEGSGEAAGAAAAPAEDNWLQNMGPIKEERALGDFDGTEHGDGYLSLTKGELLQVQRDGSGEQCGWAYGYSMQKQKWGWFPPTFSVPVGA